MKTPFALLAISTSAFATCAPEPPVTCYADDCNHCYCLGPAQIIANAPVRPVTCDGDWSLLVAGLYWQAHQDGMEYAIDNAVFVPVLPSKAALEQANNLIDSHYETARSNWDFGFKVGVGYASACDGWDVGVVWTHFQTRSHTHVEAEPSDNHSLLVLNSAFGSQYGNPLFARDIETSWNVELDLIDLELGREFWVSKLLSFRPFVALRYSSIDQEYAMEQKGGSWSPRANGATQDPLNNEIVLENDFYGVGVKGGFGTVWHLGCGWSLYGDLAASIVYGRFNVDEKEQNRLAISPYSKTRIMEIEDHFRASRAIVDLGLGIEWSALVCDCKYGIDLRLGWEQRLFFHQNQMWRVQRKENFFETPSTPPVNRGETDHEQRRGTLDTQGLVFSVEIHL